MPYPAFDSRFLPVGAGAVIGISTSAKRTAVLLLPEGASRTDLRFLKILQDHALKHAEGWYGFLRGRGHMLEDGDLYLVTGVDKSTSWNVAAVEKATKDNNISLKLSAVQIGSASASYAWKWETGAAFSDSGPRRPSGEASDIQNQTVFLRGFKVAIDSSLFRKGPQALSIVDSKPSAILKPKGGFLSFLPFQWARSTPGVTSDSSYSGSAKDKEAPSVSYFPTAFKVSVNQQCRASTHIVMTSAISSRRCYQQAFTCLCESRKSFKS